MHSTCTDFLLHVHHGTTVYYPFYCTDQGWPATWALETTLRQST